MAMETDMALKVVLREMAELDGGDDAVVDGVEGAGGGEVGEPSESGGGEPLGGLVDGDEGLPEGGGEEEETEGDGEGPGEGEEAVGDGEGPGEGEEAVGDGEGPEEGEAVGEGEGAGETPTVGDGEGLERGEGVDGEGVGVGEVDGGDEGAAVVEGTTLTASFWPKLQCPLKAQRKYWLPVELSVMFAGLDLIIEPMGLLAVQASYSAFVTRATSCCEAVKLKAAKLQKTKFKCVRYAMTRLSGIRPLMLGDDRITDNNS